MTKSEKAKIEKMTRADIEGFVREMCLASVRADEATARMNECLALARQRYEPEISALNATYANLYATVEEWAASHAAEFAPLKSIAMVHGTVGFRTGNPTLKPTKGMTWEKVLEVLKRLMPAYVRIKEEVDKQALTAAADELGAENLGTLGLRKVHEERFYVEVNKDAVKCEAPAA